MVQRCIGPKDSVDLVILSGQSSALPAIRFGLQEHLESVLSPSQDIRFAKNPITGKVDLKGVVSAGALILTRPPKANDEEAVTWFFRSIPVGKRYGYEESDGTFREIFRVEPGKTSGSCAVPLVCNPEGRSWGRRVSLYENRSQEDVIKNNPDCRSIGKVQIRVPAADIPPNEIDVSVMLELEIQENGTLLVNIRYGGTVWLTEEIEV